MGLSYDPGSKKWNITYENENLGRLNQDLPTGLIPITVYNFTRSQPGQDKPLRTFGTSFTDPSREPGVSNVSSRTVTIDPASISSSDINGELSKALGVPSFGFGVTIPPEIVKQVKEYKDNKETNERNKEINEKRIELETENKARNNAYRTVLATVNSTRGGDYVQQRDTIKAIENISPDLKKTLENYYKAYYSNEKIETWNPALGAKPPYGEFDAKYYKEQNPTAAQQWITAVANDDIDITQRYGENGYFLNHYTTVGKPAGARGNPTEVLAAAQNYVEKKPTEQELQQVRSLQLGIDTESQVDRLLQVPEIASEWEKAKQGDKYWTAKGKELLLDVNNKDEFIVLFRLSDRPEDKSVAFEYNINTGYGITELEDALNQAVGEKATVDVKRFAALTQNVLKDTIEEMKKAKSLEQRLSLFNNFDAFNEITNINTDLTNSILGDSGLGGVFSFMGGTNVKDKLEKSLRGITGINNEVVYNWQDWFDTTLKQKYQEDLTLGLSKEDAEEQIKIQGDFARNFIDQYLIPRFNESKSMNEFVEYLDVNKAEQNPFQTQDILNATQVIADLKANQYLDKLRYSEDQSFNSSFYFNPNQSNVAKKERYSEQASTVAADWENAKKGDPYWKQQAYRFGVDVNDKDAFARMHFQVKGQGLGYDPAEDILTASKVSDYIYTEILPALKDKAIEQGTVFGQFVRPEEFADEVLEGLNPADKDTWNEVLKQYGLTDFKGTLEELKEYIVETLKTNSGQEIRQQIKYLNERKEKPTQEILGVTYIEREEDYKPVDKIEGDTELYRIFQSAGFEGTEDEFYNDFFPDVDRTEQIFLTKAGRGTGLEFDLDTSDPFASLSTIEDLFSGGTEEEDLPKRSSYFTIDEDEELPAKSKAGQNFLDEFTSLFKGFG
jgi:hypothetical protein